MGPEKRPQGKRHGNRAGHLTARGDGSSSVITVAGGGSFATTNN